jgi:hypothetical protein
MRLDSGNPNNAPGFNFIVITSVETARWTFSAADRRFGVPTDLTARNSQDLQVRRVRASLSKRSIPVPITIASMVSVASQPVCGTGARGAVRSVPSELAPAFWPLLGPGGFIESRTGIAEIEGAALRPPFPLGRRRHTHLTPQSRLDSLNVPCMFSCMEQPALFPDPRPAVTDEEVAAVLRGAISRAGRLSRTAELYLSGVSAEHLMEELRSAGLMVARIPLQSAGG